ncbi:pseudouridine synthase [Aliikangiella sp. IMCC44359]|uniref:pseudouridine synthase n=1 Tax=Aliikangiella sp. IMCC44359 TaxID=3459125 RepID=UPI00403A9080
MHPRRHKLLKKNHTNTKEAQIVLFNKPFNTLCQFTGEANDSTLADFIKIKNIYPAGRLDKDSEGLLLLTNDGRLQHQISHPKFKQEKTYWVQVEGEVTPEAISQLSHGVMLKDGLTKPAKAKHLNLKQNEFKLWERTPAVRYRKNIPTSWLELKIKEGKNRQVRRMTAAVGFPTLRLIRISIGPWKINQLQPGEYIQLPANNIGFGSSENHY